MTTDTENVDSSSCSGGASDVRGGGGRTALLPCPFCGSRPTFSHFEFGGVEFWVVRCCISETHRERSKSDAIAAWNRRAPSAPAAHSKSEYKRRVAMGDEKVQPPADKAEAVAWRYREAMEVNTRLTWGDWRHVGFKPQGEPSDTFQVESLYAAPPTALLREVIDELLNFGQWLNEPPSSEVTELTVARAYRFDAYRRWEKAVGPALAKLREQLGEQG